MDAKRRKTKAARVRPYSPKRNLAEHAKARKERPIDYLRAAYWSRQDFTDK